MTMQPNDLPTLAARLMAARKGASEAWHAVLEADAPWRWVLRAWAWLLALRVQRLNNRLGRLRAKIRDEYEDAMDGHRAGRRETYRKAQQRKDPPHGGV